MSHYEEVIDQAQNGTAAHVGDIEGEFVHLVRLALAGKKNDVELLARRAFRRISAYRPDLATDIQRVLNEAVVTANLTRAKADTAPLPVDLDSRLELLKRESAPHVEPAPIWSEVVSRELNAVLMERERLDELSQAGLVPSRSALLVGPPGVGKTLAARWLAEKLRRPLLTLDLSSVMSSFLGKTGSNIRVVLDFARRQSCVLLLDEFDAIAKRRDDSAEIGELKRLVTVLIQAIDEWPADGLLVAATNHPELLDPAIWRRFDRVVEFAPPAPHEALALLSSLLPKDLSATVISAVANNMAGKSFAEMSREVLRAKREAVLEGQDLGEVLLALPLPSGNRLSLEVRLQLAKELREKGHSDRSIAERLGISRGTMRKRLASETREGLTGRRSGAKGK